MDMNGYQDAAMKYAHYPEDKRVEYPLVALAGEAGEALNRLKKIWRDKGCAWTADDIDYMRKELGDCLWYIAAASRDLGFTLEDIAGGNLAKLFDRYQAEKDALIEGAQSKEVT